MNAQEKKELTFQFVEFIQSVKNLIFLIKKRPEKYKELQDLVSIVSGTVEKYYLNLDLCSSCGHPVPTLPSRTRYDELEARFLKYIKTYESLTGEEFDISLWEEETVSEGVSEPESNSNFQLLDLEKIEREAEEHKKAFQRPLTAAPRLQKIAEKDKKPTIEAQLINVS